MVAAVIGALAVALLRIGSFLLVLGRTIAGTPCRTLGWEQLARLMS
jgi:hypothetical protein